MKPLVLHYPPKYVVEFAKNWRKSMDGDEMNTPAQKAMVDDMIQMLQLAAKSMVPQKEIDNGKVSA